MFVKCLVYNAKLLGFISYKTNFWIVCCSL